MAWIFISIGAAIAQTLRFMFQKHLRTDRLSTGGATYARFVYAFPLIATVSVLYSVLIHTGLPTIQPMFWMFASIGGVSQIVATMCVVALFQHRNFTVGLTFKKTEVIQTAIIGFVVLGDTVSAGAALAIGVGVVGVLLLSDPPQAQGRFVDRIFNRAAGLGLLSGVLFGMSAVFYRGATLEVVGMDVFHRSSITLTLVIFLQLIMMTVYLWSFEKGQITAVLKAWRVAVWVGVLSLAGSLGWFTAFALQNAAYVKAVGQVEVVFSIFVSVFVFGEAINKREVSGIVLLLLSVVLIVILS